MNSIWNNNIKSFKSRFPQLAQMYTDLLQEEPAFDFWTIEKARSNDFTASENGLRLHSAYNPRREAQQAVLNSSEKEKSTIVFYGFGLGWHVVEWALTPDAKAQGKKLVLIEPDPSHFFASLTVLDWTEVFRIQNLIIALACPIDQIMSLLEDSSKVNLGASGVSDACFFEIPAFMAHAKDYFDAVKELVARNKRKNEINAATLKKFGKLWTSNSIKNLNQMCIRQGILELKNKAPKELPFLLIAAGPSLQTILPDLQELKKRCVIVCVETAVRLLLKNNIQPDFILLTDPQFWAYRHIAGTSALEATLITEISVYPSVFRYDCKSIMLCSSQFPIGQFFEKSIQSFGDLGTGGSVASAAWNFCEFCGAEEIYTAGLDLSFPGNQTHAKGSTAEQTFHTVSSRINTAEKLTSATLFSAGTSWQKDFTGKAVLSDSRMKMFAWWFESRISACPHVKTYTLCPQSLEIPGIIPVDKTKLLSKPEALELKTIFMKAVNINGNKKNTSGNMDERNASKESQSYAEKIQAFLNDKSDFLSDYPWMKEFLEG